MAVSVDSILKLSTPKKILILVTLLTGLTGVYFYSFYLPQSEEIASLDGKLTKLKADLTASQGIIRDLQTFRTQIQGLEKELTGAVTQLPNEKEIPDLLKNISSLGKESNLEFILFRPKPEEPQQFYARVPIELTIVGTYHNTGLFFDRVSRLHRIINVVDFSMTRAKDGKGKGDPRDENLVRTSCLVMTYRFIEKKEENKSEQKEGAKEPKEGASKGKK
jgi:type IV pilus assembly protein PilO